MSKLPPGRTPLPDQWFIEKAKRLEEELKQYAVMIDVDGDWMYVPENTLGFNAQSKPRLFRKKEWAEEEASQWNTGVVVDYDTKHILPFTQEERERAKERAKANNGS